MFRRTLDGKIEAIPFLERLGVCQRDREFVKWMRHEFVRPLEGRSISSDCDSRKNMAEVTADWLKGKDKQQQRANKGKIVCG